MPIQKFTFKSLSIATKDFSNLLGSGATGEVYLGDLPDGIPIAVKRLRIPPGASRDHSEDLVRRFEAELNILTKYTHPRLVRLLGTADDSTDRSFPFALIFELLEGGSLADWLQGPQGEPATRGPPLSAAVRIDIALGAISGLAYLHGLQEEGGFPLLQGAAAHPTHNPVLHRDIKSANIGLTIRGGGEYYAKLLDCGLAKAMRGDVTRDFTVSFTGGLPAGTPGYMAPELTEESCSVRSEVYAMGIVLLELFIGARLTRTLREELEDFGIEKFLQRADPNAAWTPKSAEEWLKLALECVHVRPAKRPPSMAALSERLREIRAQYAEGLPPLIDCPVCLEEVAPANGVKCKSDHFICLACLQDHVINKTELFSVFARTEGYIPCTVGECKARWTLEDLETNLQKRALVAYSKALRMTAFDAPRAKREHEERLAKRLAAARAKMASLSERVQELRKVIVERDLQLRCPRCSTCFVDYDGCNALTCGSCGAGFCALCLVDCGGDAHSHYETVHRGPIFDKERFLKEHRERRVTLLVKAISDLAPEGFALQRALVKELDKADLRDLEINASTVLRGAGVPEEVHQGGKNDGPLLQNVLITALNDTCQHNDDTGDDDYRPLAQRLYEAMEDAAVEFDEFSSMGVAEATCAVGSLLLPDQKSAIDGVCAVAFISTQGNDHCLAMVRADVVQLIINLVDEYAFDNNVTIPACVAIALLARGGVTDALLLGGAHHMLVKAAAMKNISFPAISWAIGELAGHSNDVNAAIIEAGALSRLFYGMDTRRNDSAVMELSCVALKKLCSSTDLCDEILKSMAPRTAIRALGDVSGTSQGVIESTSLLLAALAEKSSRNEAVLDGGSVPALIKALKQSREKGAAAVLTALAVISNRCKSNKDAVRCAGGEDSASTTANAYKHSENVQVASALLALALQ